ncbi:hypothetical protein BCR37DRAFT_404716 [Protomyces lactucae-debilis]|uniref:Uncharacterized protein n=1 Tax=Protomyces lactucae-debilis TaxID=2754530 RepID=A0A1Y2FA84_PROLT|nr:uncharacterized protein BCR37DRAFT_404716 [Protomyces lactucae-debilis]ORY80811.1 hypothetical protein BCR37DRAFT_404716 [Protomyces lactucae-debilis]
MYLAAAMSWHFITGFLVAMLLYKSVVAVKSSGASGSSANWPTIDKSQATDIAKKDMAFIHSAAFPQCRNVSIDYWLLVRNQAADDKSIIPHLVEGFPHTAVLSDPTRKVTSKQNCIHTCKNRIDLFNAGLSSALQRLSRFVPCWGNSDFTILNRKAIAIKSPCVGQGSALCDLEVFCECDISLLVHYQLNATKSEMRHHRWNDFQPPNPSSQCDLSTFAQKLGGAMEEQQGPNRKNTIALPFREWRFRPDRLTVLNLVTCPSESEKSRGKPPAEPTAIAEADAHGEPKRKRIKKDPVKEICYCRSVDGKPTPSSDCGHTELVCRVTSYAEIIQEMKDHRIDLQLLAIYLEQYPGLANNFQPISRTDMEADQLNQEILQPSLPDLNLPARGSPDYDEL